MHVVLSIAAVHSFSLQSSIPLNEYTIVCLFILLSMGIWVCGLMLLWTKLLRTFAYLTFTLSFLGINLNVQLLSHRVSLTSSYSRYWQTFFQSDCTNLHSWKQCLRVPVVLYLGQYWVLSVSLIFDRCLVGSHWGFNFISQRSKNVENFYIWLLSIWLSPLSEQIIHICYLFPDLLHS